MLELANQYAALLQTSILASRQDGDTIIFVLASGPKLTMTEAQLRAAIKSMQEQPQADAAEQTPAAPTKSKRKGK